MRPYEQVAFQWSCHTIRQPNAQLEHFEWINVIDAFPNFQFAESLMENLRTEGTFLIWSMHAVVGAALAAPILYFGRKRAGWANWQLLALVIPFCMWVVLMLSPLSAGRKSLANLGEPSAQLGVADLDRHQRVLEPRRARFPRARPCGLRSR